MPDLVRAFFVIALGLFAGGVFVRLGVWLHNKLTARAVTPLSLRKAAVVVALVGVVVLGVQVAATAFQNAFGPGGWLILQGAGVPLAFVALGAALSKQIPCSFTRGCAVAGCVAVVGLPVAGVFVAGSILTYSALAG